VSVVVEAPQLLLLGSLPYAMYHAVLSSRCFWLDWGSPNTSCCCS
jgi:hypothetical protein